MARLYRAQAEGRLQDELTASTDLAWREDNEFTPLVILSDSQAKMHHLSAAAEKYRQAVVMPIGLGANPRRINARVNAITILGDIHHELEQFDAQLQDANLGQSDHMDRAIFFSSEASALVGLGKPLSEIEIVIKRATASGSLVSSGQPLSAGQASMASMLALIADELRAHGRQPEAIGLAKRAMQEIEQEIAGTAEPTPTQLVVRRRALMQAEDWQEAYSQFRAVVKGKPDNVTANGNLGVIAVWLGKAAEARDIAGVLRGVNVPYIRGEQHYQRARVLAALGDADAAVIALKRSFREGYGWTPGEIHRDIAFDPIRENADFKEFCAPRQSPASTSGGRK